MGYNLGQSVRELHSRKGQNTNTAIAWTACEFLKACELLLIFFSEDGAEVGSQTGRTGGTLMCSPMSALPRFGAKTKSLEVSSVITKTVEIGS